MSQLLELRGEGTVNLIVIKLDGGSSIKFLLFRADKTYMFRGLLFNEDRQVFSINHENYCDIFQPFGRVLRYSYVTALGNGHS